MTYLVKCLKFLLGSLIVGGVVFTFLAVVSYNAYDQSMLSATSYSVKIHNFSGKHGAAIAAPILQVIGYSVFLPLLFLLVYALKLFKSRQPKFMTLRVIALLFGIATLSTLLAFISKYCIADGLSLGGAIGTHLKQFLLLHIDSDILFISLCYLFAAAAIFCLGLTLNEWKSIFRYIYYCAKFFGKILGYFVLKLSNQKKKLSIDDDQKHIDNFMDITHKSKTEDLMPPKSTIKQEQQSILPSIDILNNPPVNASAHNFFNRNELKERQEELKKVLRDYGIKGEIINYSVGPVVTLYELEPAAGTKASRVIGLSDDIARSMSAISTRIAVIPGKNVLGIEIPNEQREVIYLRELIESRAYQNNQFSLPLVLGKDIAGQPVITDLAKMPHLLVAGTTGSGKSVAINTMVLSLLYSCTTKRCKLVMIDPKMLELSVYDGIPHLLSPVVTDPKKAVEALKWVVQEMERRYRAMASFGVRNIAGFNELLLDAAKGGTTLKKIVQTGFNPENGEPTYEEMDLGSEALPFIVVIVDEMADLMLVAGKEIEGYIQRIAQMARASGIHLIMATQRPSVDVITGVIKANFPTRISFQVTSKIDSRTILGEQGAEQLLGRGDMLYMMPGGNITRVHGPFVSDLEVENVVKELKTNSNSSFNSSSDISSTDRQESGYVIDFNSSVIGEGHTFLGADDGQEDLYQQAVKIVIAEQRPTTSYIQRRLKIGYNRAASLIEQMEQDGIITPPNTLGKREVVKKQS
nr:DNA translocase FtsK 4TM domain-containing protein [Candidatus Bandiella woodruffii]